MKILYLEDNTIDAELFQILVQREVPNTEVTVARTYREYVDAINSEAEYDLIICDYRLPDYNGLSAIDFAKSERPGVPVLFVTGARKDLLRSAEYAGADYAEEKLGFTEVMKIVKKLSKPK